MTGRERVLGLCLAGAVGGFGLVKVAEWTVVKPFKDVDTQIKQAQSRQSKLKKRLKGLSDIEERWQGMTQRTLSRDPQEAQRRFREDMHELLERHGLDEPKVTPGNFVARKNDFVDVPLNIRAAGTLREIVGFLTDFYRRDYLARIDKVTIAADQGVINSVNNPRHGGGGRRGRGSRERGTSIGPEGPTLRFSVSAVTVVLPDVKDVEHLILDEITEQDRGRLVRAPEEYTEIFDTNIFKPYEPPRRVVQQPQPQPEEEEEEPVAAAPPDPTPPPPPPPPPPPDWLVLVGVTADDAGRKAYVLDEREAMRPPAEYCENAEVEGGVLLLIHRRGMVIRTNEGGTVRDYFYPLGASFAEREELDPEWHPEVWRALEEEFVDWASPGVAGVARSD